MNMPGFRLSRPFYACRKSGTKVLPGAGQHRHEQPGAAPSNIGLGSKQSLAVTERLRVQFRRETFHRTNTPTLDRPDSNIECGDDATIRGGFSVPRRTRFALRFEL
jgi:hypothetical protein